MRNFILLWMVVYSATTPGWYAYAKLRHVLNQDRGVKWLCFVKKHTDHLP